MAQGYITTPSKIYEAKLKRKKVILKLAAFKFIYVIEQQIITFSHKLKSENGYMIKNVGKR